MPPKRGRGQGARGRGSPRAKMQAAPTKPDPVPEEAPKDGAAAAETCADVEEPTSTIQTVVAADAECESAELANDSLHSLDHDSAVDAGDDEPDEEMELSDAEQANVTSSHTRSKDVIIIADTPHDVIVIDDDHDEELVTMKLQEVRVGDDKESMTKLNEADMAKCWMLRVCPVPFQGFVKNEKQFLIVMAKSLSFELRMSRHLCNKNIMELTMKTIQPYDAPWLPRERMFRRGNTAATAAMLEIKLIEKFVPEVIQLISSCDFQYEDFMRFELTKITREEAMAPPLRTEEEIKKEADEKMIKEKTEEEEKDSLQVNLSKRLQNKPNRDLLWKQPEGSEKTEEDDYIFVKNIPDELPDTILKAIMNTEMVERKMGENNTGSAIFKSPENMYAQQYMEWYNGILVNSKALELSTTLGSLIDAKKARFDMLQKSKGEKRKSEGDGGSATPAKRIQKGGAKRDRRGYMQNAGGRGGRAQNRHNMQNTRWGRAQNRGNMQNDRRGPAQNRGNMQNDRRGPAQIRDNMQNARGIWGAAPNRGNMQNSGGSWGPAQNGGNMQNAGGSWGPAQNGGRIQPQIRPLFSTNMDMNPGAPLHMMEDLQAKLMEKQRELNFLQNQARLQMTMLEEQKMAIMSRQQQMASSQGGQRDFQQPDRYNWL